MIIIIEHMVKYYSFDDAYDFYEIMTYFVSLSLLVITLWNESSIFACQISKFFNDERIICWRYILENLVKFIVRILNNFRKSSLDSVDVWLGVLKKKSDIISRISV